MFSVQENPGLGRACLSRAALRAWPLRGVVHASGVLRRLQAALPLLSELRPLLRLRAPSRVRSQQTRPALSGMQPSLLSGILDVAPPRETSAGPVQGLSGLRPGVQCEQARCEDVQPGLPAKSIPSEAPMTRIRPARLGGRPVQSSGTLPETAASSTITGSTGLAVDWPQLTRADRLQRAGGPWALANRVHRYCRALFGRRWIDCAPSPDMAVFIR